MLYSASRLGSLLTDLSLSTFHNTALGLTAAAALFANSGAYAQGTQPRIAPTSISVTQGVDDGQCGAFTKYVLQEARDFKDTLSPTFLSTTLRFLRAKCAATDANGPIEIITENFQDGQSLRTALVRMGKFDILAASGVKHSHRPVNTDRPVTTGSGARPTVGG